MSPLSGTAPVSMSPRGSSGDAHAVFRFPAHPSSVAAVRRETRQELRRRGVTGEACDDVVLVVSELVTNAIVHAAGETVVCELRVGPEIYVRVGSEGRGGSHGDLRPSGEGGRGLFVVEALSTSWGVDTGSPDTGWTAWATLSLPAPIPVPVPIPARIPLQLPAHLAIPATAQAGAEPARPGETAR